MYALNNQEPKMEILLQKGGLMLGHRIGLLFALVVAVSLLGSPASFASSILPRIDVINDSTMGVSKGTSDVLILGSQSLSSSESFPESTLTLTQGITCTDVRGRPALCTSVFKDVTLGLHEAGLISAALSDILTLTITDGATLGNGVVHVAYESDPGLTEGSLRAPFGGTTATIEEQDNTVQDLTSTLQTLATGGTIPEPSPLILTGFGVLLTAAAHEIRQRRRRSVTKTRLLTEL
jgi:hypothetical protein